MTCEAVREHFHRYVDGEAEARARLMVEGHVSGCAACARELAEIQRVADASFQVLGELPAPAGLEAAVLARLERAPRRRFGAQLSPRVRRQAWFGGLAAMVALVLFTLWVAALPEILAGRQTLVLGQTTLAWNSTASLRVVAYRDWDNREPLAWKPVSLEARRRDGGWWYPLYRGRTNAAGTVDVAFRVPAALEGPCVLRVQTGGLLAPDRTEQAITVERKARVLLSTDKPLYQPGQTLHMRVLAMDTGSGKAAADRPLTLEVKDPKGTAVYRKELRTSRFGIASADFQLAELVGHGRYQIVARVGEDETLRTVTVKPYVLPKFRVDAKPQRPYYAPGDRLRVDVKSVYFFGKPVAGGKVTVQLAAYDVGFTPFATLRGVTGADGRMSLETRLPSTFVGHPLEQGNALVRLKVAVTDSTGHLEEVVEAIPVAVQPFRVSVVPESGRPVWGLENVFYLVTSYPDGTVARTSGTVVLDRSTVPFVTDATGIATVRLQVPDDGLHFQVQAADTHGRQVKVGSHWPRKEPTTTFSDGRDWPLGQVLLRTDASVSEVGTTLGVEVLSSERTGTVYLDIARGGQTMLTRSAELKDGRGRFAIDLSDDLTGTLALHAYVLTGPYGLVRDTRMVLVRAGERLRVELTPSQEVHRPGEEARVRVKLTDTAGRPAPGAVGLAAVDASVFALREQDVALERDYFAMEQSVLEPRYQDKFSLPPSFAPDRVLSRPGGERRAAVTLACLSSGGYEESNNSPAAVRRETDPLAPDYPLWSRSRGAGSPMLKEFQKGYFAGLSWFVMLLCLVGSTLHIVRRNRWALAGSLPILLLAILYGAGRESVLPLAAFASVLGAVLGVTWARRIITLAEVLVIVGIIGVLAALLFPVFARSREMARNGPTTSIAPSSAAAGAMDVDDAPESSPRAAGAPQPLRVREYFPETLFWSPEVITDDRGEVEVTVPAADSITTWRLSAVASTAGGLVGSSSVGLRVFQDFFLDLDLPVTLTQHDQITIPVAVHNYLATPQSVEVALKPAEWFRLEGPTSHRVQLAPNSVGVVRFPITALSFGKHLLEVSGTGSRLSDALRREVEVLPDGEAVEGTESDRLEGSVTRTVRFPDGTLPGTQRLLLRLQPGTFSQVVSGLDGLLKVPYG